MKNSSRENVVKLSSTIGPVDAGIIPLLARTYEKQSGIKVEVEKAGTGLTLEKAKTGDFDMVIVHARALEDKFINDGYGINRRDIMYNDFVILGPKDDPAGIKFSNDAAGAFAKIAAAESLFITRGDLSGTHVKEMEVWEAANLKPDSKKDQWYHTFEDGYKGNGPTTLYADSRQAYFLMDRATYLIQKNNISVVPLVEGDKVLLNFIAAIQVNPAKFPQINNPAASSGVCCLGKVSDSGFNTQDSAASRGVLNPSHTINSSGAKTFIDWLCADEAQTIIRDFEVHIYNEPLFFPNSDEWNKKL